MSTQLFSAISKTFLVILLINFESTFAQGDYKLEKVDSISKSKSQIYSETKQFIAEFWNSAKDVIQNDDKEEGLILVKGMTKTTIGSGLSSLEFWYRYNVKFLMKDNKYKIVVENITFDRGPSNMWAGFAKNLEPQTEEKFPGLGKSGMSEKKWNELMTSLKTEMKNIIDSYVKVMSKSMKNDSNW